MRFLLPISLTFISFVGCQSLRPKSKQDFIAPIASSESSLAKDVEAPPKTERELCMRTAETVARSGHLAEAIALYENAERIDTEARSLDRELAPLYAQSGDFDQAISRYRQAITKTQDDAELTNNLAWTLMQAGRIHEASTTLDAAINRHPDDRRLLATRAVVLYHSGDRDAAFSQFASLYGDSTAHHNLALLDIEVGNTSGAKAEIQKAMAKKPSSQTVQLATAIGEG